MGFGEYHQWIGFRNKFGPLNGSARIERAVAQLSLLICVAHGLKKKNGGSFDLEDFLPYGEKQKGLTLDKAIAALGGKITSGKKKAR